MDDQHPPLLSTLTDRLRGNYTLSILPKDREIMGAETVSRQFQTPPISHEAADRIEQLEAINADLLAAAKTLLDVIAEPLEIVRENAMDNALQAMADAVARAEGEVPA